MVHRYSVWLHRWAGLLMALFLVVVGLTGTLLAFRVKLDRQLNPQLYADGKPGQPPLDLATLAERAEALVPEARPGFFSIEFGQSVIALRPRTNPATRQPYQLAFDHLILDPYTGRELGRCCDNDARHWRMRVMPFIYDLHANLVVGPTGEWILGVVALVWTLDCFVGFYLTLPRSTGGFWNRWKVAWQIKWWANTIRVNFDLHRAGGLWFWLLSLVFAWSSVMLALRPVYERVTRTVFDYQTGESLIASALLSQPNEHPHLGWRDAQAAGERLMAEQAAQHGFAITRPYGLAYIPEFGVYAYDVRCSADIRGSGWDTGVWIDGDTGALRHVFLPSGQHAGNTISTWLWGLHYGDIHDFLPYRILVSFFGLAIVMLSATGIYIWWKKRRVRKKLGRRHPKINQFGPQVQLPLT